MCSIYIYNLYTHILYIFICLIVYLQYACICRCIYIYVYIYIYLHIQKYYMILYMFFYIYIYIYQFNCLRFAFVFWPTVIYNIKFAILYIRYRIYILEILHFLMIPNIRYVLIIYIYICIYTIHICIYCNMWCVYIVFFLILYVRYHIHTVLSIYVYIWDIFEIQVTQPDHQLPSWTGFA